MVNLVTFYGLAKVVEKYFDLRVSPSKNKHVITQTHLPKDVLELKIENGYEVLVKPEYIKNLSNNFIANTKFVIHSLPKLISITTGLQMLTQLKPSSESSSIHLFEPIESDVKLSVISIDSNSELIISPRYIVGIRQRSCSPIRIKSKWLLNKPSALLSGMFRVFVFSGDVDIVLKGARGISLHNVSCGQDINCENVIAYSSSLNVRYERTETFWAFHRNKRKLYNYNFSESGVIIQEVKPMTRAVTLSGFSLERVSNFILRAFGL